jgi:hypothetical protein
MRNLRVKLISISIFLILISINLAVAEDAPFPEVGCSFTYVYRPPGTVRLTEMIVNIIENREFKGEEVYAAEVIINNKKYINYYDKETANFIAQDRGWWLKDYYKNHEGILKRDMQVGETWETEYKYKGKKYKQTIKVVGEETLFIGDKLYRTMKLLAIRGFLKCTRNRQRYRNKHIWYSPELAMVVKADETKDCRNKYAPGKEKDYYYYMTDMKTPEKQPGNSVKSTIDP